MSYEQQGFDLLSGRRPYTATGAIAVSSTSSWAYAGMFAVGAIALGAVITRMRRPSEPEWDATMKRVSALLGKPRAIIEVDAPPEILRLARKGMTPETIAFGIWQAERQDFRDFNDAPQRPLEPTLQKMGDLDKLLSRAPAKERQRLLYAWLVQNDGAYAARRFGWSERQVLAPQYPHLHVEDSARVALGIPPKKLFEPAAIPDPTVSKKISSDAVRHRFVQEQSRAIRDQIWKSMSDDERMILALKSRMGVSVGKPPAGEDPDEESCYPDLASAIAAVKKRDDERRARRLVRAGEKKPHRRYVSLMKRVTDTAKSEHYPDLSLAARSPELAKWELAACKDPQRANAYLKPREFAHGNGGRYVSSYALEMCRADVEDDPKVQASASPEALYKAFQEAKAQSSIQKFGNRLLYATPSWWPKIPGVQLIRRAPDLLAEGQLMHHCLGTETDAERALAGYRYFAHMKAADGDDTTIEFDGNGRVLQFQAHHNTVPSDASQELMRELLAKIGARQSLEDVVPERRR